MVRLANFVFKQVWSVTLFALPIALRLFWFAFTASIRLSILAIISMFRGIPNAADAIAKDWTRRAIDAGFPYLWERQLYRFFYGLAACTIVLGWAVLFFISVFTVDLLFEWIF